MPKMIPLGEKMGEPGCCCAPASPDANKKYWYPSLRVSSNDQAVKDLPEEGTLVIKVRRTRIEITDDDNEGKKYNCYFDVIAVAGGKSEKSGEFEDREDALSRLKTDVEAKREKDYEVEDDEE